MLYKVFFQLYGKKMKVAIEANSEQEVKEVIKNGIIFDKIVKVSDYIEQNDETLQNLKNILGI